MAAEVLAGHGHDVLIADQKPSFGRKFLMAGKSGLNLTKSEDEETFLEAYAEARENLRPMLKAFGSEEIQNWVVGLKQSLFTGTTGRVFPTAMKASPLLRAWLARLDQLGVARRVRWCWAGWKDGALRFETPDGQQTLNADAVVLALGGGSWAKLGSDGAWADTLSRQSVPVAPFQPSNAAVVVNWSAHMDRFHGQPLKNVALKSGEFTSRGESVITKSGLEGGGVYSISNGVRDGHELYIDLLPDADLQGLSEKLAKRPLKLSLSNFLRKAAKLDPIKQAVLRDCTRALADSGPELARQIKNTVVPAAGVAPIDGAISTAGGVRWDGVDAALMLKLMPGVFVAGEMLDWEAPTGGYLLSACFASGHWAGNKAHDWLAASAG